MYRQRINVIGFFSLLVLLVTPSAFAESDKPGSNDHPKIPRVAGTTIVGYAYSDYDEGVFQTGVSGNKLVSETAEGKRTRIIYLGTVEQSPLGILRNYQKALEGLGAVKEVYSCKKNSCFRNLGTSFIWRPNNRMKLSLPREKFRGDHLYLSGGVDTYQDQSYWYGTVQAEDALFHVSVYSAVRSDGTSINGHPLIHLEVIEVADFVPTLEVVKAEEMSAGISKDGHIAIYGIHFDFDSDVVKPESAPTLEQIAKALQSDPALSLYVVGHTDNQGTTEYNEDLSKRRAESVVRALVNQYGIANSRLVPLGVGLAAPVATNKTEEGRALNRRVELVER